MSYPVKAATGLCLALAAMTAAPAVAAPLSNWHGRYVWEEHVGRRGGSAPGEGIEAFVTYTLALGPGNGPTGCRLIGQGLQTNRRIQCTATPQRDSVVIKFYRFGPDNIGGGYRTGTPLFTLTRTQTGVVTRLQGLRPSSDATRDTGRLFQRAR